MVLMKAVSYENGGDHFHGWSCDGVSSKPLSDCSQPSGSDNLCDGSFGECGDGGDCDAAGGGGCEHGGSGVRCPLGAAPRRRRITTSGRPSVIRWSPG